MAADNVLLKYFDNFKGLDLRISDLKREAGSATETLNCVVRRTGALSKRKGYQIAASGDSGGSGLFNFKRVSFDGTTLSSEDQLLTADSTLHKSVSTTINMVYSPLSTDREAYYTMFLDDSTAQFKFQIYDDNILVYDKIIGNGLEATVVKIQEIVDAINSLPNFTCTLDGDGNLPAALIPIKTTEILPDISGTDIVVRKWEEIARPSGNSGPFTSHWDTRNNEDFHPLSTAVVNDTLYLTGDKIPLQKYDGNRVYSAGIPKPEDKEVQVLSDTILTPVPGQADLVAMDRIVIGPSSTQYKWNISSETNSLGGPVYYLTTNTNGDPETGDPDFIHYGAGPAQQSIKKYNTPGDIGIVPGSISTINGFAIGDYDSLGFDTIYFSARVNGVYLNETYLDSYRYVIQKYIATGASVMVSTAGGQGSDNVVTNVNKQQTYPYIYRYNSEIGTPSQQIVDEISDIYYFGANANPDVQGKPEVVFQQGVLLSEVFSIDDLTYGTWFYGTVDGISTPPTLYYKAHNWENDTISGSIVPGTFPSSGLSISFDRFQIEAYFNTAIDYIETEVYETETVEAFELISSTSGSLTGTYKWKFTYEYHDANGNVLESTFSDELGPTVLSSKQVTLALKTISKFDGYNTDQGVVFASNTTTNISLEEGHNIKQYDVIAIPQGDFVERRIVKEVNGNVIKIDGEPLTVTAGDVISSVTLKLYRTKADGSLFYLHSEVTNNTSTTTISITDNKPDTNLGPFVTDQATTREPAPVGCKYITVWRNNIILSGNKNEPRTVFFSDVENQEYFPAFDNSFLIETPTGKDVTGIKGLDNLLYVFTEDAISAVSGDLQTTAFLVDVVSNEGVGCLSHHTITELKGELWFLDDSGVYSISGKGLNEVSAKIQSEFDRGNPFSYSRARAYNWIDEDRYMLHMPVTAKNEQGEVYNTGESKTYVFDKFFGSWYIWDNYDISGGIVRFKDKIYFTGNTIDEDFNIKKFMYRVHDTTTTGDYADHNKPISFIYRSHWETLGEPSVFKKYRRIKIISLDASLQEFESEAFSLNVTVEHDYEKTAISDLFIDFGGGAGSGWGDAEWGLFPWGEIRLFAIKRKLNQRKAKSSRVSFLNDTLNQNVLISGYELDTAVAYRPEIKE